MSESFHIRILCFSLALFGEFVNKDVVKSCITGRRSFIKSFVKKIEVDDSEAKVYYTIPMPPSGQPEETFAFRTPRMKERRTQGVR